MAKLGHPDGEVNLTKGAANTGIVQIVPSDYTTRYTSLIFSDLEQRLLLARGDVSRPIPLPTPLLPALRQPQPFRRHRSDQQS